MRTSGYTPRSVTYVCDFGYVYSKGALVTYIAIMHDVKRNEVFINYDVQKLLVTPAQLVDFQNVYNRVMEKVLAHPDAPLNELF